MKRLLVVLLLTFLLSLLTFSVGFAENGAPAGSCPPGFELHPFMDHQDGDPMHQHVHLGVKQDINGDGYICMKELSPTVHLHIDNFLP